MENQVIDKPLIHQFYTDCMSEASYYIESNGEAAIIDPLRDIQAYLDFAKSRGTTIKYVLETHLHADFVSGHTELAKLTGATIVFGPHISVGYPIYVAADNERLPLGKAFIQALHTPGHTLESTCYLLLDKKEKQIALFSGDTIFVGNVGRPDLVDPNSLLTPNDLAGMLYDSIQDKITTLDDDVLLYPAHGAGSSCGKGIGKEKWSTIGEQRNINIAFQEQTKEAFIQSTTEDLPPIPPYFELNVKLNREKIEDLSSVVTNSLVPLSTSEFSTFIDEDKATVLDTRPGSEFMAGYIPGSVFIGLEGRFAEWAGSILDYNKPLILVTPIGKEKETITRLARVGFNNVIGFLDGGFEAWKKENRQLDLVVDIDADELVMDMSYDDQLILIDVRKPSEFEAGHVSGAINIPLADLTDLVHIASFEDNQNLYVHCAGGYRSVIACSLFKQQGVHNIRNVHGGWAEIIKVIEKEGMEIETVENKN